MAKKTNDQKAFVRAKPGTKKGDIKLTEALIKSICSALQRGAYVETAAAMSGIGKDTFYRWLREAKTDTPPALTEELSDAVERAMAEAEMRDLLIVDQCAAGSITAIMLKDEEGKQLYDSDGMPHFIKPLAPNLQAATWRLERRHPRKWGHLARLEHSGPEGKAIQLEGKSAEELRAERLRLQAILDEDENQS